MSDLSRLIQLPQEYGQTVSMCEHRGVLYVAFQWAVIRLHSPDQWELVLTVPRPTYLTGREPKP